MTLPKDIEPILGSNSSIPSARKTVLWQPYCSTSNKETPRCTKDDGPSGHPPLSVVDRKRQVQRSSALVSLESQYSSSTAPQHARQVSTGVDTVPQLMERYV